MGIELEFGEAWLTVSRETLFKAKRIEEQNDIYQKTNLSSPHVWIVEGGEKVSFNDTARR